jgi:hypothetical protein
MGRAGGEMRNGGEEYPSSGGTLFAHVHFAVYAFLWLSVLINTIAVLP